jgi:uncharacterized protein
MPRPVFCVFAFFVLGLCTSAWAAFPWENLDLGAAVNDHAGLLSASESNQLETKLDEYNLKTGNALVLVTLKDLSGGDIDDAANRIFARAGIGQKGRDNGALLLISLGDRRMRIEVGYGLEGVLTDAKCAEIIRRDLTPAFREGRYYAGIDAAFGDMQTIIGGGDLPPEKKDDALPFLFLLLGVPVLIIALIVADKNNPKHGYRGNRPFGPGPGGFGGGGFSGGGFSGGGSFGGFGGGMSGGGGASGGW